MTNKLKENRNIMSESGKKRETVSPLVSIIIPTYNRADLIGETLESVIAQTYPHWECIVVDDGSSDNTDAVVSGFIERDGRFRFYPRPPEKPKGANPCRNYGLRKSGGEYAVFLDSDDLLLPEKLELQIKSLLMRPEKIVSITQSKYFSGASRSLKREFGNIHFKSENVIIDLITKKTAWGLSSGVWLKKSLGRKPFDELVQGGQDWCFHIKQVIRNDPDSFLMLDIPTVLVRLDNESMSRGENDFLYTRRRAESRLEILRVLKKQAAGEAAIKAAKLEIIRKVFRLFPVSKKRRTKFNEILNSAAEAKMKLPFSAIFRFSLLMLFLYKLNSGTINGVIILLSKLKPNRTAVLKS
jgi:glycosyltransferase involved in cell wall biosynthesis